MSRDDDQLSPFLKSCRELLAAAKQRTAVSEKAEEAFEAPVVTLNCVHVPQAKPRIARQAAIDLARRYNLDLTQSALESLADAIYKHHLRYPASFALAREHGQPGARKAATLARKKARRHAAALLKHLREPQTPRRLGQIRGRATALRQALTSSQIAAVCLDMESPDWSDVLLALEAPQPISASDADHGRKAISSILAAVENSLSEIKGQKLGGPERNSRTQFLYVLAWVFQDGRKQVGLTHIDDGDVYTGDLLKFTREALSITGDIPADGYEPDYDLACRIRSALKRKPDSRKRRKTKINAEIDPVR